MGTDRTEFFDKLYREQIPGMFRYAKYNLRDEYLAETAVQEAMLAVWKKIDVFIACDDPVSLIFGYLKNIVKNIKSEQYMLQKRIVYLEDGYAETIHTSDEISVDTQLGDIISKEEFSLLKKLYVYGYSYKELAEELGVNPSVIGMRVKRSKEKFINKYKK